MSIKVIEERRVFDRIELKVQFFFRASRHFWSIDTRPIRSFWLKIVMERMQEEMYETSIGRHRDETTLETSSEGDRHGSRVDVFIFCLFLYMLLRNG